MDIAALSTVMSHMKIQQEASLSVTKMAMDTAKEQMNDMVKTMEMSVNPHLGGSIDIKL
ncbi:Putative motility protein [Peptoclostridium litorale DSM 5388]|uniref:Motility protein n=1 Tax=Peptoclostridium litorale DSM 5388 TaxID=1121324 RepID=A0A069REZ6_PEPLI|nr:YjfB family protein [Peptoclostridium litorale]KDR94775.1 hypothetical protein CLIT_13c00970 [Peptoclostridium litorale DSM 5388]SIN92424.1 Putative motility protein [Peptoclostridium litorale DSM 5388]